MTTWTQFLADVRTDLQDTATSPRWSDAYLFLLTKLAIRDFSQYFPKRVDREVLVVSGSGYSLPSGFVDVIHVECPENNFLRERGETPGQKYSSTTAPTTYFISGGKLYLNGTPGDGDVATITYFCTYSVPTSETDTSYTFEIPDKDLELPMIYVRAKAHEQMRAKTARLDRFDVSSGRRDDNPLMPEVEATMEDYYRKISERMRGAAVRLYKA